MATTSAKKPTSKPIEHVVIIIKENHCFDNYFGTFPGANGAKLERSPNPPPQDPNHRHDAWLTRKTTAVRQQFVEQDVPAYFAYARQFTLATTISRMSLDLPHRTISCLSPPIPRSSSIRRGIGCRWALHYSICCLFP